jgi:hypothetical protein
MGSITTWTSRPHVTETVSPHALHLPRFLPLPPPCEITVYRSVARHKKSEDLFGDTSGSSFLLRQLCAREVVDAKSATTSAISSSQPLYIRKMSSTSKSETNASQKFVRCSMDDRPLLVIPPTNLSYS